MTKRITDPDDGHRPTKQELARRALLISDVLKVAQSSEGRRFLAELLEVSGFFMVFQDPESTHRAAHLEGRRFAVAWIWEILEERKPSLIGEIVAERTRATKRAEVAQEEDGNE